MIPFLVDGALQVKIIHNIRMRRLARARRLLARLILIFGTLSAILCGFITYWLTK